MRPCPSGTEMHYLFMSDHASYPAVELITPLEELEWVSGASLPAAPPPLTFHLEGEPGFIWPDFIRPNSIIPLFSEQLRDILTRSGADNVEYFPAQVVDTVTNSARSYWAANVLGLVSAMDKSQSEFMPARRHPVAVRSIDKLVLDESRCADFHIFRLAEYDMLVVVSERVVKSVEQAQLQGIVLLRPEDWDGLVA
jgi:hypothetical protein